MYVGFAKAFDKCDHGAILRRLKTSGISGKLGIWLHKLVTCRQHSVCVIGSKPIKGLFTSGVPQGSLMGPPQSDINKGITLSILLSYADDTKIFSGISAEVDEENCSMI